jgi:N6-adenosine-specific RNA methylase IME4
MTIDEIKTLPVARVADARGSACLLWVPDPLLPVGLEVMKAWGFEYKTVGFTWTKLNKSWTPTVVGHRGDGTPKHAAVYEPSDFFTGMGYYTRANPEMCLLGTRGCLQRLHKDVRQLVISPRREHSRKPDEIYGCIERLFPGPYLELFARTSVPGWDVWGNETGKFAPATVNNLDNRVVLAHNG